MGSSASTGLTQNKSDLGASLPPQIFAKFCKLEQECEKIGKSPQETYRFLSEKYQEYLDCPDKTKFDLNRLVVPTPVQCTTKAAAMNVEDLMKIILHSEVDHEITNDHERRTMNLLKDELSMKFYEINLLSCDTNIDAHSKEIIQDVFRVRSNTLQPVIDDDIGFMNEGIQKDNNNATNTISESFGQLLTFECELCRMKFESTKLLQAHINHSEIHAANVRKQQYSAVKTFRKDKVNTKLTKNTVQLLSSKFSSNTVEGDCNFVKSKWKQTISKTVCNNTREFYNKITNVMCFIPNEVKVLFQGLKTFYRSSTSSVVVDLRVYFHTESHCIEIVPHIVSANNILESLTQKKRNKISQNNPEIAHNDQNNLRSTMAHAKTIGTINGLLLGANNKDNNSNNNNSNNNSSDIKTLTNTNKHHSKSTPNLPALDQTDLGTDQQSSQQQGKEDNGDSGSDKSSAEKVESKLYIELPRIYLDYNTLLGCVMGFQKQESGLLAHVQTAADENASIYRRTVNRHGSVDMCMDRVLIGFVNSHLKMAKPPKKPRKTPKNSPVRKLSIASLWSGSEKSVATLQNIDIFSGTTEDNKDKNNLTGVDNNGKEVSEVVGFEESLGTLGSNDDNSITKVNANATSAADAATASDAAVVVTSDSPITTAESTTESNKNSIKSIVSPEEQEIRANLKDYTIRFDDSECGISPVFNAPKVLVPIPAVCADQIYIYCKGNPYISGSVHGTEASYHLNRIKE